MPVTYKRKTWRGPTWAAGGLALGIVGFLLRKLRDHLPLSGRVSERSNKQAILDKVQAEFFARLGLFTVRQFLDVEACSTLRAAVRSATSAPSTVSEGADAYRLDQTVRRTLRAHVPAEKVADIRARVARLKPSLESHFGDSLGACQEPQFLVYRPGDFFAAHADAGDEADEPEIIRKRRVSVVIFLSSESAAAGPAAHGGGSLVFYGLLDDERAKNRGLALTAEEGLLVAFRASQLHSVSMVTAGERLSIVSWFEAESEAERGKGTLD